MSALSSVGQRFSQLIQALGMSKNAFAISLDKTATVIQHLVDERNKPGFDLMNKVVDVYPNVSIEWLLRGKGPMLLNSSSAPEVPALPTPPVAMSAPAPGASLAMPAVPPPAALNAAPAAPMPGFPTPLFAVSAARQPAPAARPSSAGMPAVEPTAATAEAMPFAGAQEAVTTAATSVATGPAVLVAPAATAPPESLAAASPPQLPPTGPAAALDAATLTAALHAQHLQHQLALAEQRNQHLLEQQKLILERQVLMQQMLDVMRRPI